MRPSGYCSGSEGLPELAMTDHCPNPDDFDPKCRMALQEYPDYQDQIKDALAAAEGPEILAGIEGDSQ